MNISYRHDTKDNYMVLSDVGINMESYDLKMITKNTIDGILPVTVSNRDNTIQLYYKITSKQNLESMYSCSKIGSKELFIIMKSIVNAVKNIELYLLNADYLYLDVKYVFVNLSDLKTQLCYYPGNKKNFSDSLFELVQKLLTITDHTDSMATQMVYGIYEICNNKDYLLSDIEKFLNNFEEGTYMQERYIDNNSKNQAFIMDGDYERDISVNSSNIDKSKKIVDRIKDIFSHSNDKKNQNNLIEYKNESLQHDIIQCEEQKISYIHQGNNIDSTMLLNENPEGMQYVLSGVCGCEDIRISKFPFIIGKITEKVDGVVNNNMVSRIHARLTRSNNILYIEDLNSKNGTYVNDYRVEPHELMQLEVGDCIRLANNKYILN